MESKLDNVWEYSNLDNVCILMVSGFKLKSINRKQVKNKEKDKLYFEVEGDLTKQKEIIDKYKRREVVGNLVEFIFTRKKLLGMIKSM